MQSPSLFSPLHTQEDFERILSHHRQLWLAEAAAEKAAFDAAFAARKAELTAELETKLGERRAIKNMVVALVFVLRLVS